MKKTVLLIGIGILIGFYLFTPEEGKLETVLYTQIEDVPPGLSKFMIETKVGRKIAYVVVKKKTKAEIKKLKEEAKDYLKEWGIN